MVEAWPPKRVFMKIPRVIQWPSRTGPIPGFWLRSTVTTLAGTPGPPERLGPRLGGGGALVGERQRPALRADCLVIQARLIRRTLCEEREDLAGGSRGQRLPRPGQQPRPPPPAREPGP